ncbi:hypothetical protein NMY22_g10097 [Coprinellus aureogranulatus]|nr:hypothetical protein NMY22_g10097 [Coprinellus aureogranulatus]
MDPLYDFASAAQRLQELAEERSTERLAGNQLSEWDSERLASEIQVLESGSGGIKRMMVMNKRDGLIPQANEAEAGEIQYSEAVWHIQGVLTSVELPPFLARGRLKDKVRFLRQGVRISGLSSLAFETAIQRLQDIVAIWSRCVSRIQVPSFVGLDDRGAYLDVWNRYFSSRREGGGGPVKALTPEIDPIGLLTSMQDEQYYHGEENSVLYIQRNPGGLASKKRTTLSPPVIVEVQVTFMLIPLKDAEWKMIPTLRCIALLDGRFTQACLRKSLDLRGPGVDHIGGASNRGVRLKRRSGLDLDDEEEQTLTVKVARMEIDAGPSLRQ